MLLLHCEMKTGKFPKQEFAFVFCHLFLTNL